MQETEIKICLSARCRVATQHPHTTLTCQTDLVKVHTIGHQHQAANALGSSLFGCQIAQRFLVLGGATERGDAAAGLKVEAGACAH